MTSDKDRYRILWQNLCAEEGKKRKRMFEGDGNYEVLHSCENRGCFEISYYVQRHYACHNTQLIKTYHQLGRYLNIISSSNCFIFHVKGHAEYLYIQWFILELKHPFTKYLRKHTIADECKIQNKHIIQCGPKALHLVEKLLAGWIVLHLGYPCFLCFA